MKIIRNLSRIIAGLVFIFSGFVKAVDPLGSAYKFNDYFLAFGMDWAQGSSLYLGIILCLFEFVLGFAFLFNVKLRSFSWFMLLFMLFFLGLTFYLAIANPVSDCGCFGDAIVMTNWQTFYKNLVLIVLIMIVFFQRNKFVNKVSNILQVSIIGFSVVLLIGISVYSLNHLPVIDFMPWKLGSKIAEKVVPTPEKAEITLIYKNKETGESYEYTSKTLPWQDTAFFNKLEFIDQKKKIIQEYKEAPIHDFMIDDENKVSHTAEIIGNPEYQFLLVCYDLDKSRKDVFSDANSFYSQCLADSISFVALTGTGWEQIDYFRHDVKAQFEFFTVDETALKSVVRANPGLVLLKNGVVLDKWHWRDFPEYSDFKANQVDYEELLQSVGATKKE